MSVAPGGPESFLLPVMYGYLKNIWLPSSDIEVEQTAYGTADTIRLQTPLYDAKYDFGALTQQNKDPIPFAIKVGASADPQQYTAHTTATTLIQGFLDYTDSDYDEDYIEFYGRGPLALLVDGKITTRMPMNVDVGDAIKKLITDNGLTAQVGKAGINVGTVLRDDYVAIGRNERVMDLIAILANGVGWTPRVKGQTVIVDKPPPRSSVPVLTKTHNQGGDVSLKVQHSALHAHDIKVTVVSYLPHKKTRVRSGPTSINYGTNPQTGESLQVPVPKKPSSSKATGPAGRQSGMSGGNFKFSRVEEYVFHIPGLTKDQCDAKAKAIEDELSRHEFVATIKFTPTLEDLRILAANSPEFLINLRGCAQASHNQLYHPRRITWTYSDAGGIQLEVLAVNHDVPINTENQ